MNAKEEKLMRDLWDALHEAAYESCFNCHEYLDDCTHEGCGEVCHYPKQDCFVQKWLKVLQDCKKFFDALAENQKSEE